MQMLSKTQEAAVGLEHTAQHAMAHMFHENCRSCLYEAEERDKCRCLRSEHVRSPICAYRNEKALPGAGAQPHPFVGTEAATHTSQTALFHTEPHRLPGTLEQCLGRTGWPGL